MEAAEGTILGELGFGAQELDAVRALLVRFGEGVRSTAQAQHLDALAESIDRAVAHVLESLGKFELTVPRERSAPHDPTKTLARIAGAAFLAGRFHAATSSRNSLRAFTLKVAYVSLQDSLDHLLDHGTYDYDGAVRLYHDALGPMTAGEVDLDGLVAVLRGDLNPDQAAAAAPIVRLIQTLREGILNAPNGPTIRPYLRWVNERFALAQTASVFLRRSELDVTAIRRIASTFWAPHGDLVWHERFAAHLSWVTDCSLFDLCFSDEPPSPAELRDHMSAWYYFDGVISYLDHLADLRADYEDGIVNDALLSMGESRPGWRWDHLGADDRMTERDVHRLLRRVAEFERRALRFARGSGRNGDGFHAALALMIPVVMLSRCEPDRRWILPAFLQELAPALGEEARSGYHSAMYSQHGSPRRTHRGFVTRPWNPRDFRMPS